MSRPYIKINSMTHSSDGVLSLDCTYYKLRNSDPSSRTLTVSGLSSSFSVTLTHDSVDYSSGRVSEGITFSIATLGTSSTTTYVAPTFRYTFGGTVSSGNTRVSFTMNGISLGSVTASSAALDTYLSNIASSLVFSGTNSGYSVTAGTDSLVFYGPSYSGNRYNGVTISLASVNGASGGASFTYSQVLGSYSNGTNNYAVVLNYSSLGGSTNYTLSV